MPLGALGLLIALSASCASGTPVDLDDYDRFYSPEEHRESFEANRQMYASSDGGGSVVLTWFGDQLRLEKDTNLIFGPSGARVHGQMAYRNLDADESKDFTLIALLDFHQTRLRFNGNWDYAHPVLINPEEEQLFTIETDPLADGGHSLILAIVSPSFPIRGLPPDSGVEAQFSAAIKLYLVIGGDSSRPTTKPLLESVADNPTRSHGTRINKERMTQEGLIGSWGIEEVTPGAEIEFFVHVSNGEPDDITLVMVPLIAYRQPEYMRTLHARVPAGTRHTYRQTLRAPAEEGDYEMFFLSATNLYEYLTWRMEGIALTSHGSASTPPTGSLSVCEIED